MLKRIILIMCLTIMLPSYSAYTPLSNSPINNSDEFYNENEPTETNKQEEFFYPAESQTPPEVDIPSSVNYAKIYNQMQEAPFSYQHNIDPDQYYDLKDSTWAIYPLLRLNSPIYFKSLTIEPGYYLINPREHNGEWYILLKQNGLVKYIIPTYDRSIVPMNFYENHIARKKDTPSQKVHKNLLKFLGKHFQNSKRQDQVQCYMEINDMENYFISFILYYGNHKYSTVFRSIKL